MRWNRKNSSPAGDSRLAARWQERRTSQSHTRPAVQPRQPDLVRDAVVYGAAFLALHEVGEWTRRSNEKLATRQATLREWADQRDANARQRAADQAAHQDRLWGGSGQTAGEFNSGWRSASRPAREQQPNGYR
jgi:hypothetical protein